MWPLTPGNGWGLGLVYWLTMDKVVWESFEIVSSL